LLSPPVALRVKAGLSSAVVLLVIAKLNELFSFDFRKAGR